MRIITRSDRNEITVKDNLGGADIIVYYRTPTAEELRKIRTGGLVKDQKTGKRVFDQNANDRKICDFALAILTGFRDGDLGIDDAAGNSQPISSDPSKPNYFPDWKTLIADTCSDILAYVGSRVANGASAPKDADTIDFADDDSEEGAINRAPTPSSVQTVGAQLIAPSPSEGSETAPFPSSSNA